MMSLPIRRILLAIGAAALLFFALPEESQAGKWYSLQCVTGSSPYVGWDASRVAYSETDTDFTDTTNCTSSAPLRLAAPNSVTITSQAYSQLLFSPYSSDVKVADLWFKYLLGSAGSSNASFARRSDIGNTYFPDTLTATTLSDYKMSTFGQAATLLPGATARVYNLCNSGSNCVIGGTGGAATRYDIKDLVFTLQDTTQPALQNGIDGKGSSLWDRSTDLTGEPTTSVSGANALVVGRSASQSLWGAYDVIGADSGSGLQTDERMVYNATGGTTYIKNDGTYGSTFNSLLCAPSQTASAAVASGGWGTSVSGTTNLANPCPQSRDAAGNGTSGVGIGRVLQNSSTLDASVWREGSNQLKVRWSDYADTTAFPSSAANSKELSSTIVVDSRNPTGVAAASSCTGSGNGTGGSPLNGWYSGSVTCSTTGSDTQAGVDAVAGFTKTPSYRFSRGTTCSALYDTYWPCGGAAQSRSDSTSGSYTFSREGTTTVESKAIDQVGNSTSATATLKIDSAPPEAFVPAAPCTGTPGDNGWYLSSVDCTVGGADSYRQSVLSDNPVLYWKMDETSGSSLSDFSGNNRTGSINKAVPNAAGALEGEDSNSSFSFASRFAPASNQAAETLVSAFSDCSTGSCRQNTSVYDPSFSQNGTKIAFVAYASGASAFQPNTYAIYTANSDGTNKQKIVSSSNALFSPSFSPDGQYLVYTENTSAVDADLKRVPSSGGAASSLNSPNDYAIPGSTAEYSPDGTKIVYSCTYASAATAQVCTISSAPSADPGFSYPTKLTTSTSSSKYSPSYLGGDDYIVYQLGNNNGSEIWTIGPAGENPQKRSSSASGTQYSQPYFSKSGSMIYVGRPDSSQSQNSLYIIDDATGSDTQQRLLRQSSGVSDNYTQPVLSEDGTTLLASYDTGGNKSIIRLTDSVARYGTRVSSTFSPFVQGSTRTFEGWAKREHEGTIDTLFSSTASGATPTTGSGAGLGEAPVLRVETGRKVCFWARVNAFGSYCWDGAWPASDPADLSSPKIPWTHWVLVYNDATGTPKLYINGQLQSGAANGIQYNYSSSPGDFQIGQRGTSSREEFNGSIDEIAVYSGELSASDVIQHYKHGLGNSGFSSSSAEILRAGTYSNLPITAGNTFSVTDEGSATVYPQAVDNAGNRSTARDVSMPVKIDKTAPTASVTGCSSPNGSNGWYKTQPTCSLQGSDSVSGVASVSRSLDAANWTTVASSASDGTASLSGSYSPGEGITTLYARSKDRAGRVSADQSQQVKVDTVQPTDTTTLPGSGTFYNKVVLSPSGSDATSGFDSASTTCELRIVGSASTQSVACSRGILRDDEEMRYTLRDNAGNTRVSAWVNPKIDTGNPSIVTQSPSLSVSGDPAWTANPVKIVIKATDTTLGSGDSSGTSAIKRVVLSGTSYAGQPGYADKVLASDGLPAVGSAVCGSATDCQQTVLVMSAEGDRTLSFRAEDNAGNLSAAQTVRVRIDKTPPSVGAIGISPSATKVEGNLTLSGSTSDPASSLQFSGGASGTQAGSGLSGGWFATCGGQSGDCTWSTIRQTSLVSSSPCSYGMLPQESGGVGSFQCLLNTGGFSNGWRRLRAQAVDVAGNIGKGADEAMYFHNSKYCPL